jgi:hypothetical protein
MRYPAIMPPSDAVVATTAFAIKHLNLERFQIDSTNRSIAKSYHARI